MKAARMDRKIVIQRLIQPRLRNAWNVCGRRQRGASVTGG